MGAGILHVVAVGVEPSLRQCEGWRLCLEAFAVSVRGVVVVPGADAVFVESAPGKFRSGIQPAVGRDDSMADAIDRISVEIGGSMRL